MVCVGERNPGKQLSRLALLRYPISATIRGSKDGPKLTDGGPVIRVGKRDPQQIIQGSTDLLDPSAPPIGGSHNHASSADDCAGAGIRPGNASKGNENAAARLLRPGVAPICRRYDRAKVTYCRSMIRVCKGNAPEIVAGSA